MSESKPIVLVAEEEPVLGALAEDLRRRFGGDFDIVATDAAEEALRLLDGLAGRAGDRRIALVIAGDLASRRALTILDRAKVLHPMAKRIQIVDRDYAPTNPVVRAMMFGRIDYHLSKPWRRERTLYPAVSEFLASWAAGEESLSGGVFRIVGDEGDPRTHELKDMLTRTGIPIACHTSESAVGSQLLDDAGVDRSGLPLLIRYDGTTVPNPSNVEILEAIGMRTRPGSSSYDVVVIGAGPAGLAAGVYGASEGLEIALLEAHVTGGQAGSSSLIRNYLGFAHGISGQDFAVEACEQVWLFGADLVLAQTAESLTVDGDRRIVRTSQGQELSADAVVLATGVRWRRLGVPELEDLVGSGVFYGAAGSEARAMTGQDVFVVGGGNSAGQAALNLAKHAASVTLLIRRESLEATMSRYLITAIDETPNVVVRPGIEIVGGGGEGRLESLVLRNRSGGGDHSVPAQALFVLIGAEPHTEWLPEEIARDEGGFILTGSEALGTSAHWPLERPPMLLETAIPGVFAAGDVRSRSIKRVASAVGDGATAVQLLHEYFRERDESARSAEPALG